MKIFFSKTYHVIYQTVQLLILLISDNSIQQFTPIHLIDIYFNPFKFMLTSMTILSFWQLLGTFFDITHLLHFSILLATFLTFCLLFFPISILVLITFFIIWHTDIDVCGLTQTYHPPYYLQFQRLCAYSVHYILHFFHISHQK